MGSDPSATAQLFARRRLRIRRTVERLLLVVGLLLLAVYGMALLDRSIGSSAAISAFEEQQEAPQLAAQTDTADFSLWSVKRLKAYRDSLALMKSDPLAVLAVDRLQLKAPVFPDTDELSLNRGVGWIPGTAKPGEPGNSGIAGHRDGFFRALKDIAPGDAVHLQTRQARITYRVDEIQIVNPDNTGVLRSRGSTSLTLVTCYPFYFAGDAPKRFIVHAKLEKQAAISSGRNSGSRNVEAAHLNLQGVNK